MCINSELIPSPSSWGRISEGRFVSLAYVDQQCVRTWLTFSYRALIKQGELLTSMMAYIQRNLRAASLLWLKNNDFKVNKMKLCSNVVNGTNDMPFYLFEYNETVLLCSKQLLNLLASLYQSFQISKFTSPYRSVGLDNGAIYS
jgi:hypothetical protein